MITAIPAITSLVVILNQATKWFGDTIIEKNINKYIPIFSVVYGLIIGLICLWQYPEVLPTGTTWFQAMILGIASGSASTGLHQIGAQLSKDSNKESIDNDDSDT